MPQETGEKPKKHTTCGSSIFRSNHEVRKGQDCSAALFYEFSLEDHVPHKHLVRSMDRFVDLTSVGASPDRETVEAWQEDYINQGPHSALRNLTPREFAEKTMMDKLAA